MFLTYLIIFLIIAVPVAAYMKKALNLAASIIAAFMIAIALIPGANYAVFLIAAFLLISILERVCRNRLQATNEDIIQKTGTRDAVQVLVNGGVAMICVILWKITNKDVFLICFASSLIESFGDSAASDIGIAVKQQAYDICHFRKVTAGLSGGISFAGTIGGFMGCALLSVVAYALRIARTPFEMCVLVVAAFFGCIVDSILGSLFQRKNKCVACGKITEKTKHCNQETIFYSGIKSINNDMVNLMCNGFSAVVILLMIR